MNRDITLRTRAVEDLRAAQAWYENQQVGLGLEFLACVAEAMSNLERDAERFPVYYRGFRRILLKRFPYKLFYRLEDRRIVVFRFLHSAQDHRDKMKQS